MKKVILFALSLTIVLMAQAQDTIYYFTHSSKAFTLSVNDSLQNLSWEKLNPSNIYEPIIGVNGNTMAGPYETATYRVTYHAECGDIVSDQIEVVVYDSIQELIPYKNVGLEYFYNSGISAEDMKTILCPVEELLTAGYSLMQLSDGGFFLEDFLSAGITDADLTTAGIIGEFTDVDGKTYKWVKVGMQVWMAENMAYVCGTDCKYRHDLVESRGVCTTHKYKSICLKYWENCRFKNCDPYDIIYVAETGQYYYSGRYDFMSSTWLGFGIDCAQTVCPEGWRLPSENDWNQLFTTVGYDLSTKKIPYVHSEHAHDRAAFEGKSAPLFVGGATGLNFDYKHGHMQWKDLMVYDKVSYATSTIFLEQFYDVWENPRSEALTVTFTNEKHQATLFVGQDYPTLVRCVRD